MNIPWQASFSSAALKKLPSVPAAALSGLLPNVSEIFWRTKPHQVSEPLCRVTDPVLSRQTCGQFFPLSFPMI